MYNKTKYYEGKKNTVIEPATFESFFRASFLSNRVFGAKIRCPVRSIEPKLFLIFQKAFIIKFLNI